MGQWSFQETTSGWQNSVLSVHRADDIRNTIIRHQQRGSTMTGTNRNGQEEHDDQLGEIYPTTLNELSCTFGVSFSRFHWSCRHVMVCGRHGMGPWANTSHKFNAVDNIMILIINLILLLQTHVIREACQRLPGRDVVLKAAVSARGSFSACLTLAMPQQPSALAWLGLRLSVSAQLHDFWLGSTLHMFL